MSGASSPAAAVGLVLLTPATGLALLALTGAFTGSAAGGTGGVLDGLPDPGTLVRWGLPAASGLRDVAAVAAVGLLVAAALLFPGAGGRGDRLGPAQLYAARLAAVAAAAWVVAGTAVLVFSYADLAGQPVTVEALQVGVPLFVTDFDLGRALALSVALSFVAAWCAATARRAGRVGWAAVWAMAALLPLAVTGHAAGTAGHAAAVNSLALHLVGVTVWVGGLAALLLTRRRLGEAFPAVAGRYSTLAGWCFAAVAISGVAGAAVRLESWAALASTYGLLLVAKAVALTGLGVAGWTHRRRILPGLAGPAGVRRFARLAAGELALMGFAVGAGVALSRTSPPEGADGLPASTAEALLGYPMPPPLTAATVFTSWRPDALWLPVAAAAAVWYLYAVRVLHRRGVAWPIGRTVSFVIGSLLLVAATSGSPGVYGQVLFSMHMVQHMTIGTAVPAFWVLGAPVTLALRTLPTRRDGSRGPREWVLAAVHSPLARLAAHPLVATALFIASMVIFYYSPAFELSLRTHAGHVAMTVHFLVAGYLFANVICGIDPGPTRPPHLFRFLLLMMTFGFHAFFAISLMGSGQVLAAGWYALLRRDWGPSSTADQALGAALGWGLGDYPLAILGGALIWSWYHHEARAARRHDRRADRDGDADLAAYNRYLQGLPHQGQPIPGLPPRESEQR